MMTLDHDASHLLHANSLHIQTSLPGSAAGLIGGMSTYLIDDPNGLSNTISHNNNNNHSNSINNNLPPPPIHYSTLRYSSIGK